MRVLFGALFLLIANAGWGQRQIALTVDDVPNSRLYQERQQAGLLEYVEQDSIPVAVFINEGLLYKAGQPSANFGLLDAWFQLPWVEVGNHTFAHSRYSIVGAERLQGDISKGAAISKELARHYGKVYHYFRFPFNDMGADSLQQDSMRQFLQQQNYTLAPFTVESSDWLYGAVYEYHLKQGDTAAAQQVGLAYVDKTMDCLHYFDTLAQRQYGRAIPHIYLCHDNALNADYLPLLIQRLTTEQYELVSLSRALADPVYTQTNRYYKKWGISWLYRWMDDPAVRRRGLRQEPSVEEILATYRRLVEGKE